MELRIVCSECDGTGEQSYPPPGDTVSCRTCKAVGYHAFTINAEGIEDSISNVLDNCNDIKDKLNDILELLQQA